MYKIKLLEIIDKINTFLMKFLKTNYILFFLVTITLFYYGQTLSFDFLTFDDDQYITENKIVASDNSSIGDCFQYKFKEHDYFPLTFVSFRILKNIFGFNPLVFHALNLILHLFNVILIFLLAIKLLKKLLPKINCPELWAGIISLLFSIHPMHVESVAWAIDLKDILFSFFYLLGIFIYWKWLENGNVKMYLLAIVFALLSILSKSTAITFIAILFLVDWMNGERFDRKMILSKIPFFAITLIGFYIFGLFNDPSATLSGLTGKTNVNLVPYFPSTVASLPIFYQRIVLSSFRLLFWMFHSMFPFKLNILYTRTVLLNYYSFLLPILPFVLIAFVSSAWFFRKKMPYLLYGLLFFLITISPALAKTDTGVSVFVPDRYMYLPLFGLLIILIGLIQELNRKVTLLILIPFFVFWSFKTLTYLPAWKDSMSLYNYCLKIDPFNQVALYNRSMSFLQEKQKDEAYKDLDLYIQKYPKSFNDLVYVYRGALLEEQGDSEKAMQDFNIALKIRPTSFLALLNRGKLFLSQNEYEKARTDFSSAYDIDSTSYLLNRNIASLYNKSGNHAIALSFAEKCLAENGEDFDLLRIKGVSLFYLGRNKEAIDIFNRVIKNQGEKGEMWYFRSMAKSVERDFKGAFDDLLKAKELKVNIAESFEKMLVDSPAFN
jgi:protein O-mannosyl-transferase